MKITIFIIILITSCASCVERITRLRQIKLDNTSEQYSYISTFSYQQPILVELALKNRVYQSKENEQLDSILLTYSYVLDLKKGTLLSDQISTALDDCAVKTYVLDDLKSFIFKNLLIKTKGSFLFNKQHKNVRGEARMHQYGFNFFIRNDSIHINNYSN